ncbi:tyrosine-type recombinase/integrase [Hymenobacter sp. UYCo722]|uniref:tyrosine-type recombinase/integrase n=1 Tax=Hymenobacter sp. UYCo722 TaxID=3156335 RepID=UPI003397E1B2
MAWLKGTNNVIRLDQQKTRSQVQVPVLAMAQEILDRYQEGPRSRALPVISRTKSAEAIKEILQLAGIDAPFVRVRYKGTKKHEEVMPEWQAVATHTARHTFGTLMARMGIDAFTLRNFMGHTDMKSTMVYIHLEAHHGEQSMVEGFNRLAARTEAQGQERTQERTDAPADE